MRIAVLSDIRGNLPALEAVLAELEAEPSVSVDGILFCHGSPRSDEEIITAVSPEERLAPMFAGVAERTVVCGHTHHQFARAVLGRRLLNAGSVGMPYEDEPAAWQRTAYDIGAAAGSCAPRASPASRS